MADQYQQQQIHETGDSTIMNSSKGSGTFDWFWTEEVWLPPGLTWSLLHQASGVQLSDLYWSGITALVLLVIRNAMERFIFKRIGSDVFGIKDKSWRNKQFVSTIYSLLNVKQQSVLDKAWKEKKHVLLSFDQKFLSSLLKSINDATSLDQQSSTAEVLNQRQLERWIRRKANSERSSTMSKFTESLWRMTFYSFAFGFGLWTLSDKPWFTDSMTSIAGYPYHHVGYREWWYYNLEMGFYLSLIISQFTDVPKKVIDSLSNHSHHCVGSRVLNLISLELLCPSYCHESLSRSQFHHCH